MSNSALDKLRGPLVVKGAYLLMFMSIIGVLLAAPSVSFAKPSAGSQPSAAIATFVDISQHLAGKPIYPHDIKSKDLKVGDTLDFTVNGLAATGKYVGNNVVTIADDKSLALTFTTNNTKTVAILDLQPASMILTGHNINDCQKTTVFVCSARVLSRRTNKSNLNWIAYTDVLGQITFNPPNGSLAPGQNVVVKITLPLNACAAPAGLNNLFYFQSPKNTHTILWAC
jgi:hypothetical protein